MAFSSEQLAEVKKQIINQINSTFPEDKKADSVSKIEAMNDSELINFLEQNNLIRDEAGNPVESGNCVFCSIISGEIPSTKIKENENSIAILELNPLSEGHTLIIPKKHQNEIPEETKKFAEEIKNLLKESLNPKDVLLEHGDFFGHAMINAIPIYTDSIPTERQKSFPEELNKIKERILSKSPSEKPPEESEKEPLEIKNPEIEKINLENIKFPRRIP